MKWSLRNNNNYEQTGLLVSLNYFANNRRLFLTNFWEKSKRSILKAKTEGPAAYVLSANDPRPGAQAELLRVLQKQAVEISRATAAFSVTVPVKRPAAGGGRGGRGGASGTDTAATDATRAAPTAPKTETRQFPAGSYIIRMDQPYSRIADALLDYQYWSPTDPQKNPYDDTGWTFPEGFNVQSVRVTDPKVLDVAMERINGDVTPKGGVAGAGSIYAINNNGENGLITLRYRLQNADFQSAEEPFDVNGQKFNRGSFIIRSVDGAALDKESKKLGINVTAIAAAPGVKMHPARAARVAIMHTWLSTQTEGWWRQALDFNGVPYDYISTQDVAKDANLNAKYDVILFGPGAGGAAVIEGMPMWRNPMPWKNTPETPNIGTWAQTDDMRPGLGWQGLENLANFVKRGGVYVGATSTADFAVTYGLTNGVSTNNPRRNEVNGTLLRTRIVDDASPIVYGVSDNLAVLSDAGESFSVSSSRGGRSGGGGRGGVTARATGRGAPDEKDEVQGRPALDPKFEAPVRPTVQPWQAAPITDDQLRNPLGVIPPDQRPRVALRFADSRDLFVSGLLDGGADIAQRPVVIDAPLEKGHVVLFGNNPIYRGETIGSYALVWNTIMHFDNLNAGRKLDPR